MRGSHQPSRPLVDSDDAAILKFWALSFDTKEIADKLRLQEHQVERRLHQLKDAQRAEQACK